jgi:hypothetical protein
VVRRRRRRRKIMSLLRQRLAGKPNKKEEKDHE